MKELISKFSIKLYSLCTEKMHLNISEAKWEVFFQFVSFGIVGLTNTLISYVIYVGSLYFFRWIHISESVDYLFAQVIAFVLSVLWSFFWNNKIVFGLKDGEIRNVWLALLKTYVSYSFTGLFLNTILSWIWINVFEISKLIAPIINLIVSVPINFILNKLWAFNTSNRGKNEL